MFPMTEKMRDDRKTTWTLNKVFEGGWSSEKVVKNIKITIKLLILLTAVM